jgi:L-serine dehydratase
VVYTSLFELFKIGIGPSSSHTVGPMVAARTFVDSLGPRLAATRSVRVTLHGSLGLTGMGHATDRAVMLGLAGHEPATVPLEELDGLPRRVRRSRTLDLGGRHTIGFDPAADIVFVSGFRPEHANVVEFAAHGDDGEIARSSYASIGGGFIVGLDETVDQSSRPAYPFQFTSAEELLELARDRSIADIALGNELHLRGLADVHAGIERISAAMFDSIEQGLRGTGMLPGGLRVRRRARDLALDIDEHSIARSLPPSTATDWAGVWAIAVNEENAAGHRIVTAPTNGAAGIVPAVMKFLVDLCRPQVEDPKSTYLLTASAIGSLLKANAGISGAELGCQGEVGSACAMAAAGLTAALGGTPAQVENAAEIALEHNLGLTCDPVGGLVQVPCIERNAVGAVKAITAASLALRGTGDHVVSLDVAIETMRQTGMDMDHRYKETSLGGLAVNVPAC